MLADLQKEPLTLLCECALEEVHRWATNEAGNKDIGRVVVQLLRLRNLLQLAFPHHGHSLAQRHGFHLIVGDEYRRRPELLVEAVESRAHLRPQLRVEVRERLIHQKGLRLAYDRPSHGHTLPLTSRELTRTPLQLILELE